MAVHVGARAGGTMGCHKCGAQRVDSKFCPSCGAKQAEPKPPPRADIESDESVPTVSPGFLASAIGMTLGLLSASVITLVGLYGTASSSAKSEIGSMDSARRMETALSAQLPKRLKPECDGITQGATRETDPCDRTLKGHRPSIGYRGASCADGKTTGSDGGVKFTCRAFYSIYFAKAGRSSGYISTFQLSWTKGQDFPETFDVSTDLKNSGFSMEARRIEKEDFSMIINVNENKSLRYNDPFDWPLSDSVIALNVPSGRSVPEAP